MTLRLNTAPTPTPHSESGDFCDFVALPSPEEVNALRFEDNIVPNNNKSNPWKMPEPVHYTPDMKVHTHSQSMYANSDEDLSRSMVDSMTGRQASPVTIRMEMRATTKNDEPAPAAADARNERRYRYLLEHEFNSSCELIASINRQALNVLWG